MMEPGPNPDPVEMSPRVEKAFDLAVETTKQLIALSTAVIALTITFLTDVVETASESATWFLRAAWLLYLLSILAGIATLSALTGVLGTTKDNDNVPDIYSPGIKWAALAQVASFVLAMALTLAFGFEVA
jgi:hypothetical protein